MSVPVTRAPRRIRSPRPRSLAAPAASLLVAAAACGAVGALAPPAARAWVVGTASVAWLCLAVAVLAAARTARRLRSAAAAAGDELRTLRAHGERTAAEAARLADVTLPAVAARLRQGGAPDPSIPPSEPSLRRVLQLFTAEIAAGEQRVRTIGAAHDAAERRLAETAAGLERLTAVTLPAAVERLRGGASADTALAELERPEDPRLRAALETVVRELAFSERRGAAARQVSVKVLSRVQAKAVSMLADLRDMQDRHSEEVFGDLLGLDHNTSQLGLLTDRLSLLMGGRASRAWNKPIVMESILRGAVGRIAAYRRVRLHSTSNASVVGYAAEGVMHLLAELMDNAANFSPPIDEVHVYVEERMTGLVVTIEDSGLKMPDAAMRRAEAAVAGRDHDLALLRSTRLGLVVVGLLAVKYRMSVSFRPSSRGGTGVVVLFPPELLHQTRSAPPEQDLRVREQDPRAPEHDLRAPGQERESAGPDHVPEQWTQTAGPVRTPAPTRTPAARTQTPAGPQGPRPRPDTPPPAPATAPAPAPAARPSLPARSAPPLATPGGLPVRPPGRTMAAADRGRSEAAERGGQSSAAPSRDVGERFGAFHRARRERNAPPAALPPSEGGPDTRTDHRPDHRPDHRTDTRPAGGPPGPADR
ncbi:sensor histidine kinase [Streptomyces yaizuensis]|uniref:histidine kinase n=1 Tax=Streptomyces yaizuensis TaxID=2989713 RepID=A0ABQ5NZC3_9ACTN|nr:ATP-binding protein [Streptomyces sp. YSPA8]GLF95703.1 ATP-binding protein [Streptomyces sp. YSPA8]